MKSTETQRQTVSYGTAGSTDRKAWNAEMARREAENAKYWAECERCGYVHRGN